MGVNGQNGTNGTNGSDGKGIKSTVITYQAWSSGTTTPTETWSTNVPSTTADKPYLWTKTVITYTDDTTSTSYSVGSTPEGIVVGGRNLYYLYDFSRYHTNHISKYDVSSDGTITLYASGTDMYIGEVLGKDSVWSPYNGPKMDISGATSVTYSISNPLFVKCFYNFLDESGKAMTAYQLTYASSAILKVPDGAKYLSIRIGYGNAVAGTAYKLKIKVEKGNKATDWSPAPEDVEADAAVKADNAKSEAITAAANDATNKANEAAKTATNYMKFSSDGLTISKDATTASTGQNVNITDVSVNIRNGSEVLASYGKRIVLKNRNEDAFIVSSNSRIAALKSFGREIIFESYTSNTSYFEGIVQTTNPDFREICSPNGWLFQHPVSKYYIVFNIEESMPVNSNPFYLDKVRLYEEDRTEYDLYTKVELYLRRKNSAGISVNTVKKVPVYFCDEKALSKVDIMGTLQIHNISDINGLIHGDPPFSIGDLEGEHLEMDINEIMVKSGEETPGLLYLNAEGGTVSINNNDDRAIRFQDGTIQSKNNAYYKDEGWITLFDGFNDSGNTSFGLGNYIHEIGETSFYGNKVNIISNADIDIKPTSKKVNCKSNIYLDNNMVIYGTTTGGAYRSNFQPVNSSGNCILGWGNYSAKAGYTNIYGHGINLNTTNYLKSNRELKLLWSGGDYMSASQTASLSENVTDQLNGIVLVWSKYSNGTQDYEWNCFFIPKQMVTKHPGGGHAMHCIGTWPSYKYVYINNKSITGSSSNNSTSNKINGVNVDSTNHVLRYVIGV